jgi:hypothetical protein
MKTKLTMLLLIALCALGLSAQTQTLTMAGTSFKCDAVSLSPITTFYQFDCRGVPFDDSTGVLDGYMFWFSFGHFYVTFNGVAQPTDNPTAKLDYFTVPASGNPGTFQVEWQLQDANGVIHYGVWTGTWVQQQNCGGRGCQYWRPLLIQPTQTTVDQSTVAILDPQPLAVTEGRDDE